METYFIPSLLKFIHVVSAAIIWLCKKTKTQEELGSLNLKMEPLLKKQNHQ